MKCTWRVLVRFLIQNHLIRFETKCKARGSTPYTITSLSISKDPLENNTKMLVQDPLEEIDLGKRGIKRPTYISANIILELKIEVIQLLKEYKDCFTWDYNEMPSLNIDQIKLKLPIKTGKKPIK